LRALGRGGGVPPAPAAWRHHAQQGRDHDRAFLARARLAHDDGNGELADLLAVAEWAQQASPGHVLWLAGFSFGAFIATKGSRHLPVKQLITIAPPVNKYAFAALPQPDCPWLVIQGEDDDVVLAHDVSAWIDSMQDKPSLVRMPAAGHFFHRKLMDLRGAIKNAVKGNLPPRLA
jgi:alpha/beta superfamily hydrolase